MDSQEVPHTLAGVNPMINQPTIDKLHATRLSAMADAFNSQDGDHSYEALSLNERFWMLVVPETPHKQTAKVY